MAPSEVPRRGPGRHCLQRAGVDVRWGWIPLGSYHEAITYAFKNAGCDVGRIHDGLVAVDKMALSDGGRKRLNQIFEIHQSSWLSTDDDGRHLRTYINTALTNLPAFDFPYESDGLGGRRVQPFALRRACNASSSLPKVLFIRTFYKDLL